MVLLSATDTTIGTTNIQAVDTRHAGCTELLLQSPGHDSTNCHKASLLNWQSDFALARVDVSCETQTQMRKIGAMSSSTLVAK